MGAPVVDVWSFEDIALVLERELAIDIEDALDDDMLGWLSRELDKVALTDCEMLLTDALPDELDTTPVLE
jgi:hypothetical protein